MFFLIEENDVENFVNSVNEELAKGSKLISSGYGQMYWAHFITNQQHMGEYPYPPTRTFE